MKTNEALDRYYELVIHEGLFSRNLKFYLDFVFKDVIFYNKAMLDIGGGSGIFSFYAVCSGARKVICLEPEAEGANLGVIQNFLNLQSALPCESKDRAQLVPKTIQDFEPGQDKFDMILLHNSINHLDEEACIKLQQDRRAIGIYKEFFQKLSNLASNGARLVVVANSRYNFFALLNLKNPFAPTIEWHKHQSPKYWATLLSDVGFCSPKIRWISFNRLRSLGRLLFGNASASYFLNSYFCLTMEKE